MESYVVSQQPELNIKLGRFSIVAKGARAVEAIRRPLAFTLYVKPIGGLAMALLIVWQGREYVGAVFQLFKSFF